MNLMSIIIIRMKNAISIIHHLQIKKEECSTKGKGFVLLLQSGVREGQNLLDYSLDLCVSSVLI